MPARVVILLALVALAAGPRRAGSRPARAIGSSAGPVAAAAASAVVGRSSGQAGSLLARRLAQAGSDGDGGTLFPAAAVTDGASKAAAGSAAPAPEAAAERVSQCFQLHADFGGACQVGIDRVAATVFSRGSTEDITAEQEEAAVNALRQGGLPSRGWVGWAGGGRALAAGGSRSSESLCKAAGWLA